MQHSLQARIGHQREAQPLRTQVAAIERPVDSRRCEFEPPVAESKYIVSVRAKNDNWQNFMYFACGARIGGMFVYPAHVLRNLTGDAYIRDYNYRMLPGTGPYQVSEQDVQRGRMITIRRRPDHWAAGHRRSVGTANFDNRSFRLNFEITMAFANQDFTQQIAAMLENDLKNARQVRSGELNEHGFWFRFAVRAARLTAPVQ